MEIILRNNYLWCDVSIHFEELRFVYVANIQSALKEALEDSEVQVIHFVKYLNFCY
jgi:hypothetical protein